jgi:hypothetical protein
MALGYYDVLIGRQTGPSLPTNIAFGQRQVMADYLPLGQTSSDPQPWFVADGSGRSTFR